MEYQIENFRHAHELLRDLPAWHSLRSVLEAVDADRIVATQAALSAVRPRAPRGGQTAINLLIADLLREEGGWIPQPRLFLDPELREWRMDFLRDQVGVEISFNHAEAIAWQFTRLNIAGESERVRPEARISAGVVVTATRSLKAWSRMDSAVGTFDSFQAWLREMKPILPIPIMLVGLDATGWTATGAFAGTLERKV